MLNKVTGPVVLTILDGWGSSDSTEGNAVSQANTPFFDQLLKRHPNTLIEASGEAVGLPKGQMGNSEVGHLNIGAGRIVYTGLSLINQSIATKDFRERTEVLSIFKRLQEVSSSLHLVGLISDGGVHSHIAHFEEIAAMCHSQNVPYTLHAFTDGRDVSTHSSISYFENVEKTLVSTGGTMGVLAGRYFGMDRDQNWERTLSVYELMRVGGPVQDGTIIEYLKQSHASGVTDEFIKPTIFSESVIKPNDVVVFFNYRPDRAKQLSHLLVGSVDLYNFDDFEKIPFISLFSLMNYSKIKAYKTLFPPFALVNTLGEVLERNGKKQLRIAETEKYPHVTHFFDGGTDRDYSGMKKILIPSPKVATYDLKPEMSAVEVKKALISELPNNDVVILNFANPDMVGHSGVLAATIKACEALDFLLSEIYEKVNHFGGVMIIIGDHGNAEKMISDDGQPHTAHTTNLVPFIVTSEFRIKTHGKLADIAPTILKLLGITQPEEMTGESMIIY